MRISYIALSGCLALPACTATTAPRPMTATAGCQRIGDTSRAVSDLFASGDVYDAGRATENVLSGKRGLQNRRVGAELYVHATPGQTSEYLQRTLECYTAASRAIHPNDPFHPASGSVASIAVHSAGNSFAVRVVGSDPDAAEDIWRRAQALASSSVSVEQVSGSKTPAPPL